MNFTGRWRGLKILLDTGTELQNWLSTCQQSVCVCFGDSHACVILCVHEGVKISCFGKSRIRLGEGVSVAGMYKRGSGVIACGKEKKKQQG